MTSGQQPGHREAQGRTTVDQALTGWFDDMFRIYGEMVDSQRRLAGALLGASSPFLEAGERAASHAQRRVGERAVRSTEDTVGQVAEEAAPRAPRGVRPTASSERSGGGQQPPGEQGAPGSRGAASPGDRADTPDETLDDVLDDVLDEVDVDPTGDVVHPDELDDEPAETETETVGADAVATDDSDSDSDGAHHAGTGPEDGGPATRVGRVSGTERPATSRRTGGAPRRNSPDASASGQDTTRGTRGGGRTAGSAGRTGRPARG
jgi:hypothetical protein